MYEQRFIILTMILLTFFSLLIVAQKDLQVYQLPSPPSPWTIVQEQSYFRRPRSDQLLLSWQLSLPSENRDIVANVWLYELSLVETLTEHMKQQVRAYEKTLSHYSVESKSPGYVFNVTYKEGVQRGYIYPLTNRTLVLSCPYGFIGDGAILEEIEALLTHWVPALQ